MPIVVGVIGCGYVSGHYLRNLRRFPHVALAACADLDPHRAEARAAEFGLRACPVEALLADPEIDLVINLTVPQAHAPVSLAALSAGKHVYSEKPLAVSRRDGAELLQTAAARGLLAGCAPDTFLGAGLQTCRDLIDAGAIGQPVGATAFVGSLGHESWHPDPDFYYQPGGGPLFDMGPYYLTALVHLLGPVRRVAGAARITRAQRQITSQPRAGSVIQVNTPTHIAGLLDFAGGPSATLVTSFDVAASSLLPLEIYGTAGTLLAPDPNAYGGPVRVRRAGEPGWTEIPLTRGYAENSRGLGAADLARALQSGRSPRASGALGYHVLDVMQALLDAAAQERSISLASTCERPASLPPDLPEWRLDD
jgi:predicted dehydrogenase